MLGQRFFRKCVFRGKYSSIFFRAKYSSLFYEVNTAVFFQVISPFIPDKAIMPLSCMGVEENKKTLVRRKDNKGTTFSNTKDGG